LAVLFTLVHSILKILGESTCLYTLPKGDFSQEFHTYGMVWTSESISTYIDDESQVVLNVPINQTFWQLGGWENSPYDNPWIDGSKNAPFDQEFFIILNVAVGGTTGFFPDGVGNKPWNNSDPHAVNTFYEAIDDWYPTWTSPLQVDSVTVWQFMDRNEGDSIKPCDDDDC